MKKTKRTYRVMIIPELNGNRTVSFQISSAKVSFFVACIAAIIIVSVFLMYKSVLVARKLHYYNALQNDNGQLLKENNQLRAVQNKVRHLDSIAAYLEQLSTVTQPATTPVVAAGVATKAKTTAKAETDPRGNPGPSILPVDGWITQQFTKDTTTEKGAHPGIDIAAPEGMNIKAPAPGSVIAVLEDTDYGTMVVLQHDGGFVTRYGHCAKAQVAVNDTVVQGQAIATVGNTGHSSAPHLHYEVLKNGINVDPQRFLITGKPVR